MEKIKIMSAINYLSKTATGVGPLLLGTGAGYLGSRIANKKNKKGSSKYKNILPSALGGVVGANTQFLMKELAGKRFSDLAKNNPKLGLPLIALLATTPSILTGYIAAKRLRIKKTKDKK